MGVGDGVDDGHRAGQGEFELARGVGAGEPRLARMHAVAQLQFADDGRAHRLVAVVADAHLDALVEIDAVDGFEKAVHEMLPRLLAVADDVDAGVLLQLDGEQRGVVLGGVELFACSRHGGHSLFGSASQDGFRQAAGDGGGKQHFMLIDDGPFARRRANHRANRNARSSRVPPMIRIAVSRATAPMPAR